METAKHVAGLTIAELLALAVVVEAGVILALFRLFWSRTTQLEDLLLESNRIQGEQLSQLRQIPEKVVESNAQLLEYINDSRTLHRRVADRIETIAERTAACPSVSKVLLQDSGSPGTSSKTSE
jgi:hypothetical protein